MRQRKWKNNKIKLMPKSKNDSNKCYQPAKVMT